MKVIENYKRAVENSDANSFKKVFAPQVWVRRRLDQASIIQRTQHLLS